ncbi:MAG: hypothetical protein QG673_263 [Pseudomonadota bacterium]|nr:hypothetical protein [Pseudomonadota bacterium]
MYMKNTINSSVCPVNVIIKQVADSLMEDLSATGHDFTAELIPPFNTITASIQTNQDMVMCGRQWAELSFYALDATVTIEWYVKDGDFVAAKTQLCKISGNARSILTAERTALNFMQALSGTATLVRTYVNAVSGNPVKIMDTRKTLPGLRLAQKYAVTVGGGYNQRIGLYDGVLIKENHIAACGGVTQALELAFKTVMAHIPIQIEVETFIQLQEAISAGAKNILLDNMSLTEIEKCVIYTDGRAEIEISGNVTLDNIMQYVNLGVDRISIGALTKHIQAIDLSMRVV